MGKTIDPAHDPPALAPARVPVGHVPPTRGLASALRQGGVGGAEGNAEGQMSNCIAFTVLGRPAPQGSMRHVAGRFMKCDNPATVPYRQAVGWAALEARRKAGVREIFANHHVPVRIELSFYFAQPKKKRSMPSVKPDLDKLCRSCFDAMSGIMYADDGQVVNLTALKFYGLPERTEIQVGIL